MKKFRYELLYLTNSFTTIFCLHTNTGLFELMLKLNQKCPHENFTENYALKLIRMSKKLGLKLTSNDF